MAKDRNQRPALSRKTRSGSSYRKSVKQVSRSKSSTKSKAKNGSSRPKTKLISTDANGFTREQQKLIDLWEAHLAGEFLNKNARATIETMGENPSVNHVPVMTGGVGRRQLEHFYANYFIPHLPPDTNITTLTRTVGQRRIIDEIVFQFTHTMRIDWLIPGVEPTSRSVRVVMVVVVQFDGDRIIAERIHWDQATVLVQLGLLEPGNLPVAGDETVAKVLDMTQPSNALIKRWVKDEEL